MMCVHGNDTPEFRVKTLTVAHVHKLLHVDVGEIDSPSVYVKSQSVM